MEKGLEDGNPAPENNPDYPKELQGARLKLDAIAVPSQVKRRLCLRRCNRHGNYHTWLGDSKLLTSLGYVPGNWISVGTSVAACAVIANTSVRQASRIPISRSLVKLVIVDPLYDIIEDLVLVYVLGKNNATFRMNLKNQEISERYREEVKSVSILTTVNN